MTNAKTKMPLLDLKTTADPIPQNPVKRALQQDFQKIHMFDACDGRLPGCNLATSLI
jgi:hypothetical protein